MRDTADDIATVLAGAGLSLVKGTNLFLGLMPPAGLSSDGVTVPAKCVSVMHTGSPSPQGFVGQGKKALATASCQIVVRGEREDRQGTRDLAFAIYEALNQTTPAPYVSMMVRESTPLEGPADDGQRPRWVMNAQAQYVNAPT